ncbi:hypothetical protein J6590_038707 [Homalodisca vitripennis]|nr:hypothetical protein J6590_038707 [Homalodisca vitripennis]
MRIVGPRLVFMRMTDVTFVQGRTRSSSEQYLSDIEYRSGTSAQVLQCEYDDPHPLSTPRQKTPVDWTVGPKRGSWTHCSHLKKFGVGTASYLTHATLEVGKASSVPASPVTGGHGTASTSRNVAHTIILYSRPPCYPVSRNQRCVSIPGHSRDHFWLVYTSQLSPSLGTAKTDVSLRSLGNLMDVQESSLLWEITVGVGRVCSLTSEVLASLNKSVPLSASHPLPTLTGEAGSELASPSSGET